MDPVNYSRFDEPDRCAVFDHVARLVHLRTSHPVLAVDSTDFFHVDFDAGKRVVGWRRGPENDPIVVVANFSDFTTPNALDPESEYFVPRWPATPALVRGDAEPRRGDRSARPGADLRVGGQGIPPCLRGQRLARRDRTIATRSVSEGATLRNLPVRRLGHRRRTIATRSVSEGATPSLAYASGCDSDASLEFYPIALEVIDGVTGGKEEALARVCRARASGAGDQGFEP